MGAGRRSLRSFHRLIVAALAVAACRDRPTAAVVPHRLELVSPFVTEATAGTTLSPPPSFVVRNEAGVILAGLPVRIDISEGEGTLSDTPRRTESGPTAVGQWLLSTVAGRNAVKIRVANLPPLLVAVEGLAGEPVGIVATVGGDQSGLAGDVLPDELSLKVHDQFGNGVAGTRLVLTVSQGGGEIAPAEIVTDSRGVASGIVWRLGKSGGPQSVAVSAPAVSSGVETTVTASIRSDYSPDVRFFGTPPTPEIAAVFEQAVARIKAVVVSDVVDVPLLNFDLGRCGIHGATLNETVDDVIIFASVTPIDGPGRILASAGPCLTRSQSRFVVIGIIRFDVDDLGALAQSGRLLPVVMHELLHVVGVGTLWRPRDLLMGSGTTDPRFRGSFASAECVLAGGESVCGIGSVPVENIGGAGTVEVHWREATFDAELMTGFAEATSNMPLSALTLGSIQDLGLSINYLAADPYVVPPPDTTGGLRLAPGLPVEWEVLNFPLLEVTPSGWVRPLPTVEGGVRREE